MSQTTKELKLAVLIDADNVPYSNVKGMMEEIAKYGLDKTNGQRMGIGFIRAGHYSNSAIQLYRWKKFFRFCDDY